MPGPDELQRAGMLVLELRGEVVLRPKDLEAIWYLLQQHAFEGGADGQLVINYDEFSQVAAECRELLRPHTDTYFQASAFLRLVRDEGACVPLPTLFHYLALRSRQLQLRLQLGSLDPGLSGALGPPQLAQFLSQACPARALAAMGAAAADWQTVAAQRLWLQHGRRGRLLIKELVASPLMNELVQTVQQLNAAVAALAAAESPAASEALAAAAQAWFGPANVLRLRRGFGQLDADGDGQLSANDFAQFGDGTLTPCFVQRLFAQHCCSRGGGSGRGGAAASGSGSSRGAGRTGHMDFPAFVAFVAAWEDRGSPGAARYFFPLLDLQGRGYIDQLDLYTLFKEVYALWVGLGQYTELRAEDVVAELIDLLRPADPRHITATDLERCGAGGTVVGLLADVNLLWEYENREALAQQAASEQGV